VSLVRRGGEAGEGVGGQDQRFEAGGRGSPSLGIRELREEASQGSEVP